jgi:dTDP-D-glucose 4,6-dehydratase
MILDTRLALRRGPRLFHLGDHEARGLLHAGETYNVGGETERRNIDLMHPLCEIVTEQTGKPASAYTVLIWVESVRTGDYRRWIEANCTATGRT